MSLYFTERYQFWQLLNFGNFSSTIFAENLKISLSRNRIFPNFEEMLVNAWL